MPEILLVLTHCPDTATAARITAALLDQRLAACVSEGAPVRSTYRWQGALESAVEIPLQIKCTRERYPQVDAATLARLISRVTDGTVSNNGARQVFDVLWAGEGDEVDALIQAKGLKQMNDTGALEAIVEAVLAANEKSVAEFRAGKDKAFNALVGQVMKASQGKANPAQAGELLRRKLG